MKTTYVIDPIKLILAALCCILFAALAVLLGLWHSGFFLISALLGVFYGIVALYHGRLIRLDSSGVALRAPLGSRHMDWGDIRQVGVVGLRVLNSRKKRYTGARYIYFSDQTLSEDELFQMCLKWPPKNVLFLRFNHKRIAAVQSLWAKDVELYNVGNLHF
jgi:hypothetical protein